MKTFLGTILVVGILGCGTDSEPAAAADVAEAVDTQGPDAGAADVAEPDAGSPDVGTPDVGEPEPDVAEPTGPPEDYTKMCSGCHGPDGAGTTIGYELHHPSREYSAWVVRNGRAGVEFANSSMPAFDEAALSDEALDAIFDWLHAVDQPTGGEGLYWDYCSNCHGAGATGGPVFHDLIHEANQPAKVFQFVRNGHGGTDYADRLEYMPSWTEDELADAEIDLILGYLQTL
ncbi:MAG: mono/diheme cytochrome c family protein [Myxococcota bacterium]|jgi:mono/diheme cytochrome c family protein